MKSTYNVSTQIRTFSVKNSEFGFQNLPVNKFANGICLPDSCFFLVKMSENILVPRDICTKFVDAKIISHFFSTKQWIWVPKSTC